MDREQAPTMCEVHSPEHAPVSFGTGTKGGAIYAADGTWLGSLAFPNLPPVGEYGKDWDVRFEGPLDLWLI